MMIIVTEKISFSSFAANVMWTLKGVDTLAITC